MELETEFRAFETDLRLGMFPSRKLILERNKALTHARNPGLSKYGHCLVSVNTRLNNLLKADLDSLNAEVKRMETQITQQKKHFIKTCGLLNHDPLILVRRPKSESTAETLTAGKDCAVPGFMKPKLSNLARASSIKTIDVFSVKPVKKKNLWEKSGEEKPLRFTSIVRPCSKLTSNELETLKHGHAATKPQLSFDTSANELVIIRSNASTSSPDLKHTKSKSFSDSEENSHDEDGEVERHDDDGDKEAVEEDASVLSPDTFLKGSSFITEIETSTNNTNNTTINSEQTCSQSDMYSEKAMEMRKDAIQSESENKDMGSCSADVSRTDTRQIPYKLPTASSPVHPKHSSSDHYKADGVVNDTHGSHNADQNTTATVVKLVSKQTTAPTRWAISNLNLTKGSILGNVMSKRPHSLPARKTKSSPTAATGNIRVKGIRSARKGTPKSVKFAAT